MRASEFPELIPSTMDARTCSGVALDMLFSHFGGLVAFGGAGAVGDEDDLADNAAFAEQLLRLSGLGERKSLGDDGLEFLLFKEVQKGDQILSEHFGFQPFQGLDAVRDNALASGEKPAADDV